MRITVLLFAFACLLFAPRARTADFLDELEAALGGPTPVATTPPPATPAPSVMPAPSVTPEPAAERQPTALFPDLRIRVTARRHTIISSQSTGRIEEITVRDGDHFDTGDLLVRMDSSLIELQLDRARAVLARAQRLYQISRELADMNTKGEAEVDVVRLDVDQARIDMQLVETMLHRTRVTAPFSGRVADIHAREQQYVSEGTPLLEILDDSTLELEFIVPSQWIRWFKPGFVFDVEVEETGRTYPAMLERLGGKVDPLSQSLKAYAVLTGPAPDLMEGMSGSARITPPGGGAQ